jgi:hypothetical protein
MNLVSVLGISLVSIVFPLQTNLKPTRIIALPHDLQTRSRHPFCQDGLDCGPHDQVRLTRHLGVLGFAALGSDIPSVMSVV